MDDNINRINPKLLEILVCPLTKDTLKLISNSRELFSRKASLAYPIRSGVPIMLVSEARVVREEDVLQNRDTII
ncbi:Trm112 family protein [Candidatus Liberibacter sp.]|uniref:Trm112 family protein n=1 Tax=Candidatus Liberibacter sp. TaxID=34022 RepID=UPI0015F6ACFC|nr:Trm112 family protein [Candidatus Liberibacter sp.]MBA5723924.1 Trm112 family protein [Candidatus Liberibacter sp.]